MTTIKLPYKSTDKFQLKLLELRKQYSSVVRFVYNRIVDNIIDSKDLYQYCKNNMEHIADMNSFFILSAITEAKGLYTRNKENPNIIFGGKFNFKQRCKNKISKEEYQNKRLLPFSILADALKQGNRHFILDIIENNQIVFKLNLKQHYDLELPNLKPNIKKQLFKLQQLNENRQDIRGYGYSVKLDEKYIYVSFEEFKDEKINLLETRYLGIDLNPTNIGISITEYNKVLHTQLYDFGKIIDKIYKCKKASNHKDTIYWNNKLDFETLQISKSISELSKQWNCKFIFCEELNFKPTGNKNSKSNNRLVKNLWKRNKFLQNLQKRCNISNQKLFEINPAYSSVIGNLQYDYVDAVNASIEIGRRGYEVIIQRKKDRFYPAVKLKNNIQHYWKEMGILMCGSWKEIGTLLKNSRIKYRISLNQCQENIGRVFSLQSTKSLTLCYDFVQ